MYEILCLNPDYSTTRFVIEENSQMLSGPGSRLNRSHFLPPNKDRKYEGGIRMQGYFKRNWTTYELSKCNIKIKPNKLQQIEIKKLGSNRIIFMNQDYPLLSVITVVLEGEIFIEQTIQSVLKQVYPNVEYIIIDGGSTDGTIDIIKRYEHAIDYWVSEPDKGIYDAMNKGIQVAFGNALLFLNAGDYFVGNVIGHNLDIPSFLPVKYYNVFNKLTNMFIKSEKYGLPNCHQGIVFENKGIYYDLDYNISSDYDFFLKHNYNSKLKKIDTIGYVLYDNRGFSKKNEKIRDFQVSLIIKKNFGTGYFVIFRVFVLLKNCIKYLLRGINKGTVK